MMKTHRVILALLVLASTSTLVVLARSSPQQEDFVIIGADAVATTVAGTSLTLPIPLEPRFISERVDKVTTAQVLPLPTEVPLALEPRFIYQRLDKARTVHLAYPRELIGDQAAPVLTLLPPEAGTDWATITWHTNELADGLFEVGLVPGSYPDSIYDAQYTTLHTFSLSGLLTETTYYCQISSTDRSGNTASTTSGCQFTTTTISSIYLPIVVRNE